MTTFTVYADLGVPRNSGRNASQRFIMQDTVLQAVAVVLAKMGETSIRIDQHDIDRLQGKVVNVDNHGDQSFTIQISSKV